VQTEFFDIIIVGAGASGLMLADTLGSDPFFESQSILLLEKEAHKGNNRTWCYWEEGKGAFDSILNKSWNHLHFGGKNFDAKYAIAPYTYKMVRGIDFYREYHGRLKKYANVTIRNAQVTELREKDKSVIVCTDRGDYEAGKVFNSVLAWQELESQVGYPLLRQHFLGWFVKTTSPVFDPQAATFMDFSIPQKGNTRFMYVLPFSDKEALVEYTLFSGETLQTREYECALEEYLHTTLQCEEYTVIATEKGSIPMSCYNFAGNNTQKVMRIGTAGGWAKPSTGFTFMNTYRQTRALADHLKKGKPLPAFAKKNRFWWYDLLLLDILEKDNTMGSRLFESLFRKRHPALILRFLAEQTRLWEDLYVIWACPKKIFLLTLLHRLQSIFK
jgi:lycopene beta-cyclase